MQPLRDRPTDYSNSDSSSNSNSQSQQLADASTVSAPSTTSVFQPYKPPLRERALAQTAVWVTLLLLAAIGFAAVTVWMFLPSMLPKLPLTFL
jgi:hypothetical protein